MGGLGIAGMAGIPGHAGAAPAAGATGGGGATPGPPCRSRSADPEMTRVNSPGPLDAMGGGAAGIGSTGGAAEGKAGAVEE